MQNFRELVTIIESVKDQPKLEQIELPYGRKDLYPALSEQAVDYHYGKLYKGYVDRFNKGEGDPDFNEAGAFLHNLFFSQLQELGGANKPHGASEALINRRYSSYTKFQDAVEEEAMKIQGSGWLYMTRGGEIKTIKNHAIRKDIALLIDWWEHSWVLDYQHDKAKYLANIWRIIDWEVINRRIYGGVK